MLFAIASLPALGCAASTESSEPAAEHIGQSQEALSVSQWSGDMKAGDNNSYASAAIATLNNQVVMVHTGDDARDGELYWSFSYNGVGWVDDVKIQNMVTSTAPRLAAFNGTMYMVHTGEHDTSVWMSQATLSGGHVTGWSQDFLLPYQSGTSPAIAAYAGSLYVIGATPGTGQLWMATMSAGGSFSAPSDIPGQRSSAGAPALAAYLPNVSAASRESLYMAYRSGATAALATSTFTLGTQALTPATWTAPVPVPNGITKGGTQQSKEQPALGAYKGVLHMIHTDPAQGDLIMWTYLDRGAWSPQVSLGNQRMYSTASLTPMADRLLMVHTSSVADHAATFPDFNTAVYAETFQ